MKIKRLISLLLTLVLLGSLVPALAADAGSRQDPLLSRSYVDSWSSAVLSHAEATAHTAAQTALDKALQTHDNALHDSAGKSRICTLYPGNTVALKTGDCFTVLSGDAGVAISAGALVDATDGAKAVSGALRTAHRYIACEDLQAMITCTQTVSLLLSAGASVTRFVDVPADAWYADYVEYAAVNGLMSGIGGRRFAPDDVLTRAMFVTVLGQLAQIDEADYPAVSFSDVVPGSWYAPYVAWAAQQDIVSGTGNGRFEPETPITREQMASIIARYVQSTGKTLPTIADPVVFKDMDAVSGWALDGVELMRMAGIISGVVSMTALGTTLVAVIVPLAQKSIFLALFCTMLACIVLGMGVPTTANYVIMATITAPILIKMGIPLLAAHMFVFYFGIVADITPPVALAAYAGSAIAHSNPLKTGITATKLAIGAFIIPYIFALNPSLLFIDVGSVWALIGIMVTSIIGMAGIAMGMTGHVYAHVPWYMRIMLLAGGIFLIDPSPVSDLIGLLLIVIPFAFQLLQNRKLKATAAE